METIIGIQAKYLVLGIWRGIVNDVYVVEKEKDAREKAKEMVKGDYNRLEEDEVWLFEIKEGLYGEIAPEFMGPKEKEPE